MNWNQINYMIATAEERNITKAAKKLFISQPSLSISIKQLEQELGVELFRREKGKLALTHAGEIYYDWAKSISSSREHMVGELSEIRGGERERIRIGISPHRSIIVTSEFVKRVQERYPLCELVIIEKQTTELEILLDKDQLDMIIDIPGNNTLVYNYEEIADEGMCLAVPESYVVQEPFTSLKEGMEINLEQLEDCKFIILTRDSYFGQVSRKVLEQAKISPRIICECTQSETVCNLVRDGLGIAFLPDAFLSPNRETTGIRFYKLRGNEFRRKIGIVYKKETYHSEMFREVMKILKNVFGEIYLN